MNNELVTIAIPAYKATFLREAIDSALAQDYTNIELVIVNDRSPYDLDAIIQAYNDSRIRYYVNLHNLGQQSIVHNWNKCIEYAKGEYFVLLCDDDVLLPNFVSSLMDLAHQYPDCSVFHARKIDCYSDGSQVESPIWPEHESAEAYMDASLSKKRHHTVSEFMLRTTAVKQTPYVVFPTGFYSDKASVLQWAQTGGVCSSEQLLMKFRYSDEHISSSMEPRFAIGKAQAAVAYWHWVQQHANAQRYIHLIREDTESTIGNIVYHSSLSVRLKVLHVTPRDILSLRTKMLMLLSSIVQRHEA